MAARAFWEGVTEEFEVADALLLLAAGSPLQVVEVPPPLPVRGVPILALPAQPDRPNPSTASCSRVPTRLNGYLPWWYPPEFSMYGRGRRRRFRSTKQVLGWVSQKPPDLHVLQAS